MCAELAESSFKLQMTTHSLEETQALGHKIGVNVDAGTVFALTGNLGSGKTAFVQGLARGLDVPIDYYITSPTYTLINEYPGRFPLFHVDLYRLGNAIDFEDIGLYEILLGKGVVAIEWADRLRQDILSDHLAVHFEISNKHSRKISVTTYGLVGVNLLSELQK